MTMNYLFSYVFIVCLFVCLLYVIMHFFNRINWKCCITSATARIIGSARLRELSQRKVKVGAINVNSMKRALVIDLSNSHAKEENRKRDHDDSVDLEVKSKSEPHLV